MPIFQEEVKPAPIGRWLSPPLPTGYREAPQLLEAPPPHLGSRKSIGTIPRAFETYPASTVPEAAADRLAVDGLSYVDFRDRLELIRTEFEAFISARGARRREEIFRRLLTADPHDLLVVGLQQYAACGNGDRLLLTANLLAAAGQRAYEALRSLTESYHPELVYFVDGIATSTGLTDAQKMALMGKLARAAEADPDLTERLESALEWLPSEARRRIHTEMGPEGTLGRAA